MDLSEYIKFCNLVDWQLVYDLCEWIEIFTD